MKKRSTVLDRIRKLRAKYIDIFIDNSFDMSDRIQQLLDVNSMDQKDLAKRLNKKESEISKWMSGSHNFTLKTLAKIEDVLGDKLFVVISDEINEIDSDKIEIVFVNQHYVFEPEYSNLVSNPLKSYSSNYKKATFPANC
jgi:transcriptional regulator with XRE-family HTH domain